MKIVFLPEVSSKVGSGHLMRCLALAQTSRLLGHSCLFVLPEAGALFASRLVEAGCEVSLLQGVEGIFCHQTDEIFHELGRVIPDWVVVDGYSFDDIFEQAIKKNPLKLLSLDDFGHASHLHADLVLNQNLHAVTMVYDDVFPDRLLSGNRYVLLRQEFLRHESVLAQRTFDQKEKHVLVTMGGADPQNMTALVLQHLKALVGQKILVDCVVGGVNPHEALLLELANNLSYPLYFHKNVMAMDELMLKASMALTAAGSTCWELAYMGVPMMMIPLAPNQEPVARELEKRGAGITLDHQGLNTLALQVGSLLDSQTIRQDMSLKGKKLIDGLGVYRVLEKMTGDVWRLRQATFKDVSLLFAWANDPQVRYYAYHSAPIEWEAHYQWFKQRLASPDCVMWILEDWQGRPVGQVRFDRHESQWEIDTSMDQAWRGRGLAAMLLQKGIKAMGEQLSFTAWVKDTNRASIKAFKAAGFVEKQEAGRLGSVLFVR